MPQKRWILKDLPNAQSVENLQNSLGISLELATILAQRGIVAFDEAKDFFRPSLTHLHDPFLMADMDKAVNRLTEALANSEKIMIYGDYDVDGTTSVSLMYGFLKNELGYQNLEIYIPDRYREGYGVQMPGIEYAREHGFGLIIALDCGVKSVEYVACAKEYGIDFIICDHHRPGDELPDAIAVLDPKRNDCVYPYKELTGCGVGFKLLEAFCIQNDIEKQRLLNFLDLLMCSIASDLVPITGENRVMAYYGLKQLNENPRIGLKALMNVAGLKQNLDITSVVFGIGPRINAAGRIRHADDAVKLLLSDNLDEAKAFAQTIHDHNVQRQGLDASITQEALKMIETEGYLNSKSTVLYKSDWHKGVIGIVASRCIEKFHRPTIILTHADGKLAGSGRSVPGFDLYDALEACTDHLIQFGGHTFAAGMTLKETQLESFRKKFEEVVSSKLIPEQMIPQILIDAKIPLAQLNEKFVRILNQMSPFGPENMTPVFMSDNVWLRTKPRIMKERHLKIEVYQEGSPVFEAVGFGMVEEYHEALLQERSFSICYTVGINEWNGRSTIQLILKDILVE